MSDEKHVAASTVRELGQAIHRAQEKLLDFVLAQESLTAAQTQEIISLSGELALARAQLVSNSVGISVRGLLVTIGDLQRLTREAEVAVGKIEELGKGLRVFAHVTDFATGLAMADVKKITDSGNAIIREFGLKIEIPEFRN